MSVLARKTVKQSHQPSYSLSMLMEHFRQMTNDCIRMGLANNTQTMKRLSLIAYQDLSSRYRTVPSCYRLCAISKAAGILSARRKSIKRGFPTRTPYLSKPVLVSCYGFRVRDGSLFVPLGDRLFEKISLDPHTLAVLSQPGVHVRSFTVTEKSLSLCIARAVEEIPTQGVMGVDRNLRNVTVGNAEQVTYYDVSKTVEIADVTKTVVRSFKRNDVRVRKRISEKYGHRRQERIRQILHRVSKHIVGEAKKNRQAIALEEIGGIRKLYRKGNGQGRSFRGRMNSWPFGELKRRVEYKAAWEGVPVITLSRQETGGTTMDCPRCGERLQAPVRDDAAHHRQLWCGKCKRWDDRDVIAVMNISHRAWLRFGHASKEGEGEAIEAVKGNGTKTLILRVDASKPSLFCQTKT